MIAILPFDFKRLTWIGGAVALPLFLAASYYSAMLLVRPTMTVWHGQVLRAWCCSNACSPSLARSRTALHLRQLSEARSLLRKRNVPTVRPENCTEVQYPTL